MYRADALLTPKAQLDLNALETRLRKEFPVYQLKASGQQISLSEGFWEFEFLFDEGPHVQAEMVDLAEKLAGHDDAAEMESCTKRVQMWSETPDPELEYFERYQAIIGLMKAIPGVIVIDPNEPSFL